MPNPTVPPRNELAALAGINERVIRYLEELGANQAALAPLTGSGAPVGVKATISRRYIDLVGGQEYVNTNPIPGSTTGWVLL